MEKLKVAYFGTPSFSARLLQKLLEDTLLPLSIELVITQPDRPVGRKKILTPSPVKELANSKGIPVGTKLKDLPTTLKGYDLAILYAYGRIIPENLLNTPRLGFWNIHPSLLPKYRGASPIAYPLMLGDTETGVTLMQMDKEMDHGPLLHQEEYPIAPEKRREELEIELTDLGYQILKNYLVENFIKKGSGVVSPLLKPTTPPPTFQKHEDATFTKLLEKKDGFITIETLTKVIKNLPIIPADFPKIISEYFENDLENFKTFTATPHSPQIIYNFFRGISPWPGLWTTVSIQGQGKRLKILDMKLNEDRLEILTVQLEGKNPVPFSTFTTAYPDIL